MIYLRLADFFAHLYMRKVNAISIKFYNRRHRITGDQ